MKLKNAAAAIHREHVSDTTHQLYTTWGKELDISHIREEYPRPQLVRGSYFPLNGPWEMKICAPGSVIPGSAFEPDGSILVPFSPESLLSGVNRQLLPEEELWYQRVIDFREPPDAASSPVKGKGMARRCLLHFDAVDQECVVYINGSEATRHTGGYLPFTADITGSAAEGPCLIQVQVRDVSDTSFHARGKQTLKRGGMFYTAQSGIWQCVWYEWVPENYCSSLRITPDYDGAFVDIELISAKPFRSVHLDVEAPVIFEPEDGARASSPNAPQPKAGVPEENQQDRKLPQITWQIIRQERSFAYPHMPFPVFCFSTQIRITFARQQLDSTGPGSPERLSPRPSFRPWTPEAPWLYPILLRADEDRVESYFAMRAFTVEPDADGVMRFCLNHSPCFLHGILDQGYWPDGLMTAPDDRAFVYDIKLAKSFGFNMIRKHIKIEALRWYYHCDRLGMIVWQDMVNGGASYHMPLVCYLPTFLPLWGRFFPDRPSRLLSRKSGEGRSEWERECAETVEHLRNTPSLAVWVPFNEGWGQFDALRITAMIKEKDPTRPVDHASGWFDRGGGDFRSVHNYFRPLRAQKDSNRAFVISEYGGYACYVKDHSFVDRVYGYRKYDSCDELSGAFRRLVEEALFPLERSGCSGAVYTQLSDVEEEVNGLVTYDRQVVKVSPPSRFRSTFDT